MYYSFDFSITVKTFAYKQTVCETYQSISAALSTEVFQTLKKRKP